jgi:hypothetical protein
LVQTKQVRLVLPAQRVLQALQALMEPREQLVLLEQWVQLVQPAQRALQALQALLVYVVLLVHKDQPGLQVPQVFKDQLVLKDHKVLTELQVQLVLQVLLAQLVQ